MPTLENDFLFRLFQKYEFRIDISILFFISLHLRDGMKRERHCSRSFCLTKLYKYMLGFFSSYPHLFIIFSITKAELHS